MILRLLAFGFFLSSTVATFGQSSLVAGYVITANKDTLKGFIVDRRNKWSVREISFTPSKDIAPKVYATSEIDAFFLAPYNAFYRSTVVEIDKKPREMSLLETDANRTLVNERLLLQRLVNGPLVLYRYVDEADKLHFFIQKGNGPIDELGFVRYQASNNRLVELKMYHGMLQNLTADCEKLPPVPTDFVEARFVQFVTKYNGCKGYQEKITKEKGKISGFVTVGFSSGSPEFKGAPAFVAGVYTDPGVGKYSSVSAVNIGVGIELAPLRQSSRLRPGLFVTYQSSGQATRIPNTTQTYTLQFQSLSFGPSAKLLITTSKKVNPFIRWNLGASYVLGKDGIMTKSTGESGVFGDLKKFGYTGGVSLGAQWNFITAEVRVSSLQVPTVLPAHAIYNSVDAIIGIRVFK